jgi:chromosome segregation ATPase
MDQELLAAIGEILDKKLDEKLDQKLEPIKQDITGMKQDITGMKQDITGTKQDITGMKQDITGMKQDTNKIGFTVVNILNDVHKLGEGQAHLSEGQFKLQSEIRELHKGHERIETRLDRVEALSEATGKAHRDHEKRIQVLEGKITA